MVQKHMKILGGLLALALATAVLPVSPATAAEDTGETRVLAAEVSDWPQWKEIRLVSGDPSSWRPCNAWLQAVGSIDFVAFDLPEVTTSVSDCVAISGLLSGVTDAEQHKHLEVGFKLWVPDSSPAAVEAYIDRHQDRLPSETVDAVPTPEFVLIGNFEAAIGALQGADTDIYATLDDAGIQIGRLDHSLVGLEDRLEEVTAELAAMFAQVDDNTLRIGDLEVTRAEQRDQLTGLVEEVARLYGEVDAHGQRLDELDDLSTRVDGQETRLDELDGLSDRMDVIGSVVESHGHRWSELSAHVDEQAARLDGLEAGAEEIAGTSEEALTTARRAGEAAAAVAVQAGANATALVELDGRVTALEEAAAEEAIPPAVVGAVATESQGGFDLLSLIPIWAWGMIAIGLLTFFVLALLSMRDRGYDDGQNGAVKAATDKAAEAETAATTASAGVAALDQRDNDQDQRLDGLDQEVADIKAVLETKADNDRVHRLEERVTAIEIVQRYQVEMDMQGRFHAPGFSETALNNLMPGQAIRLEDVGREGGDKFIVDIQRSGSDDDPHLKLIGVNEYDSIHPRRNTAGDNWFKATQVFKTLWKAAVNDKIVGVPADGGT